jgi:hypothetical protein
MEPGLSLLPTTVVAPWTMPGFVTQWNLLIKASDSRDRVTRKEFYSVAEK